VIFTAETPRAPRKFHFMVIARTEHGRSRTWIFVFWCLSAFLLLAAIYFWFCYVAQGIAYGDLFGIRGREKDLAAMASRAREFLRVALLLEALAVAMLAWLFSKSVEPLWQRFCFSVVLASVVDFFTYAILRGF